MNNQIEKGSGSFYKVSSCQMNICIREESKFPLWLRQLAGGRLEGRCPLVWLVRETLRDWSPAVWGLIWCSASEFRTYCNMWSAVYWQYTRDRALTTPPPLYHSHTIIRPGPQSGLQPWRGQKYLYWGVPGSPSSSTHSRLSGGWPPAQYVGKFNNCDFNLIYCCSLEQLTNVSSENFDYQDNVK